MPALLTGSVDGGATFFVSGGTEAGMRALAQKNIENFKADCAVGHMMCRHYPHNLEQVWIHEVQLQNNTWGHEPDSGLWLNTNLC
mmetsp:Transcript_168962/g.543190  ORF Transcript_168962/g.543190 Transcript_168962/m.543190 type:complete len:85 (+) Transcript_168962:127-381(+)